MKAVDTTKRYCGAEAPGFVNGVLSAIAAKAGSEGEDPGAEAVDPEVEETPA